MAAAAVVGRHEVAIGGAAVKHVAHPPQEPVNVFPAHPVAVEPAHALRQRPVRLRRVATFHFAAVAHHVRRRGAREQRRRRAMVELAAPPAARDFAEARRALRVQRWVAKVQLEPALEELGQKAVALVDDARERVRV